MSEYLFGRDVRNMRLLSYKNKAPGTPDGFLDPLNVKYSTARPSGKILTRYIPQSPDIILDAPDIVDDYYLNLVDWSPNNILAVALNTNVYLWKAGTGATQKLLSLEGSDLVCSLSWIQEGNCLAVGTSMGVIQLWDCSNMKRVRIMGGHSARVSSLSWNSYILSSGSGSGQIIHDDVRRRDHSVAGFSSHTQEVCGLQWSATYRELISGHGYANNQLIIWKYPSMTKVAELTGHTARILQLAMSPDGSTVLSAGADETLRLWKCFAPHPAKKKKESETLLVQTIEEHMLMNGIWQDSFRFSPCHYIRTGYPSLLCSGNWELFPQGLKWPECEAIHFSPSSVHVPYFHVYTYSSASNRSQRTSL